MVRSVLLMRDFLKRSLASPVFIIGFAFLSRMLVMYYLWAHAPVPVISDVPYGYELGRVARAIAFGEGFSSPLRSTISGPTAWFTPIFPYFVAGIFKLWGVYSNASHAILATFNCAFASLTILPIYGIARRSFGPAVAVGASWTWAFLPAAVFFPIIWDWDTSLAALLFATIFWATLAMRGKRSLASWAAYGALCAFGVLVNPSLLAPLPFLAGWLIYEVRKELAPWIPQFTLAILVFGLALVPWTVRNERVFHRMIVLRSNFGLELWLGNNSEVGDSWTPWRHPNDSPVELERYQRLGEIAYMAEKQHEAFQFMRTHPAYTANLIFRRFVENWLAISDSPVDSWTSGTLLTRSFLLQNCALSILALLGALSAFRIRHPHALPYSLVLLVFPLIFYLTHSSLRYRFPMDPLMAVLAMSASCHLVSRVQLRFSKRAKTAAPLPSPSPSAST